MPDASQPLTNHLGQPIGAPVPGWTRRPRPARKPLIGRLCRVEALDGARHGEALHARYAEDSEGANWTYLPYGPFASAAEYRAWVDEMAPREDPLFYAIVDASTDAPLGVASYLRINPQDGVIEVGHLSYSPALQGSTAATEAMYLMMRHAIQELGYRRYEWKCDSHNAPSRRAAERLGFQYEGVFRQDKVMKGRNRDNAWFSILDGEWPAIRVALEAWLDSGNFDASGSQRVRLGALMARGRQGDRER